jgi:hypothetical protein
MVFFNPVARSELFQAKANEWLARREQFKWDTSSLKYVDNLVIGFLKLKRAEHVLAGDIPQNAQT